MKVLSPFGPKIAVIKIPFILVKKINDEEYHSFSETDQNGMAMEGKAYF